MGLLIVHPGTFATVQDLGRVGYRAWGVPVGGSFDHDSALLANALAANRPECAVVELTLTGGVYEARQPLALALAGAAVSAQIESDAARPLTMPCSFTLRPNERLVLGAIRDGARAYLAVRGGWQTPLVLGSRSHEARLIAGQMLPAAAGTIPDRQLHEPRPDRAAPFRIVDGPDVRAVSFSPSIGPWEGEAPAGPPHSAPSRAASAGASPSRGKQNGAEPDVRRREASSWEALEFTVGRECDRMGVRLESEPLPVGADDSRLSSPVAPGAIQVAGARAIVLGVACGTMGGYPVVAHVIAADLGRLGQLRPGDAVRFQRVELAEARRLDRQARAAARTRWRRISALAADGGIDLV